MENTYKKAFCLRTVVAAK